MPRQAPAIDLVLGKRQRGVTLTRWLYDELRAAIVGGRLARGTRLPATRDLAARHGLSRGVVVGVFEQLTEEGYLTSRVGAGTTVRSRLAEDFQVDARPALPPRAASRAPDRSPRRPQPFHPFHPALAEFPMKTWARISARVLARITPWSLGAGDPAGLRQLRDAVAAYLGASRGVACSADHVVIVSGAQQAMDLIARLVLRPGDPVWIEDPGYKSALAAFRNARARVFAVRVDEHGLDPAHGRRQCPRPAAVYLTPARQYGLGVALSAARRAELIAWASATGTVLIEDDYDSEFRYSGPPLPAMRGLPGAESVFLIGTFSKVLFPSLRLGYMVVPDAWIDRVVAMRYHLDLYPPSIPQAIVADFIDDGHFARHLRRMRELYGARRAALAADIERYLGGAVRLPEIEAGLCTPAFLTRGTAVGDLVERARHHELDLWSLERFVIRRRDLCGLVLGFAAFTERQIRDAVVALARVM